MLQLHAANVLLIQVLVETSVEVLPPLKEHGVANKLEPGCELELGVFEQLLELLGADVLRGLDFVGVGIDIDVGLDEEDVVNYRNVS